MSIYPVKINEWWERQEKKDIKRIIINHKCKVCGKKANTRGYLYHAFLQGFAMDEYWCSLECLKKRNT